jgi:hypothetical protein
MNKLIKSCKCDYLRIALFLTNCIHQSLIISNINMIAKSLALKLNVGEKQIKYSRDGYSIFLRLPLFSNFNYSGRNEETPHLVIKCNHRLNDRRFIGIEFKGHPYKQEHWFCASIWIDKIFGRELLNTYWEQFQVTGIDIAIGSDIELNHYLFDKLWGQKAAIYFDSFAGFELIYLQPKNKKLEIAVYNRIRKLTNRKINKVAKEKTRIEIRIRREKIYLSDLFNEPEPLIKAFNMIKIYDLRRIEKLTLFNEDRLLAIKAMGVMPYLRAKKKYQRAVMRKAIKPFLIPLIDMDKIKSFWLDELKIIKVWTPNISYRGKRSKELRNKFIEEYIN